MRSLVVVFSAVTLIAGCARAPAPAVAPSIPQPRAIVLPPPLPDTSGWGVPVLALVQSPDSAIWAGTHGHGVFRYGRAAVGWERVPMPADDEAAFTALAFDGGGALWYGTAGRGFGRVGGVGASSRSRAWQPPGGWSWVALNGVAARGSLVVVAGAAGVRVSEDGGASWRCAIAAESVAHAGDADCAETVQLPHALYVLTLTLDDAGRIWLGHTAGVSVSADAGRTWRETDAASGLPRVRVRGIVADGDRVWAATESLLYEGDARTLRFRRAGLHLVGYAETARLPGSTRALIRGHGRRWPAIATSQGLLAPAPEGTGAYRHYRSTAPGGGDVYAAIWWGEPYSPFAGTGTGLDSYLANFPLRQPLNDPWCGEADAPLSAAERARCTRSSLPRVLPAVPRHPLLQRPISGADGNPFENPLRPPARNDGALIFHTAPGTAVRAIADGTIEAAGALQLRLARTWREHDIIVRYEGSHAALEPGAAVRAGDVIGVVAADAIEPAALRLRLLLAPHARPDTLRVNPALWLAPPEGTGVLAARVVDEHGRPLTGARLHRVHLAQPAETPYGSALSYVDRVDAHPAYGENLVVSGVVPGEYFVAVEHDERRIWRRVRIERGRITFVEFAPDPPSG